MNKADIFGLVFVIAVFAAFEIFVLQPMGYSVLEIIRNLP